MTVLILSQIADANLFYMLKIFKGIFFNWIHFIVYLCYKYFVLSRRRPIWQKKMKTSGYRKDNFLNVQ